MTYSWNNNLRCNFIHKPYYNIPIQFAICRAVLSIYHRYYIYLDTTALGYKVVRLEGIRYVYVFFGLFVVPCQLAVTFRSGVRTRPPVILIVYYTLHRNLLYKILEILRRRLTRLILFLSFSFYYIHWLEEESYKTFIFF